MKRLPLVPDYQWICHSCGASNPPGVSACGACGFPAVACAMEIDAARNSHTRMSVEINLRALASRGLLTWVWRAWPILVLAILGAMHAYALSRFPANGTMVNKLTGTIMQIVGGVIVLHSVDTNLGLFRDKTLVTSVLAWFRECPIIARSITIQLSGAAVCTASGTASAYVTRVPTTIEERIAEVERRVDELRSEMAAQNRAVHARVEEVRSELSSSIASNQSALHKLSEKVEKATVGGFKQQAFGVLLAIYGAGINAVA